LEITLILVARLRRATGRHRQIPAFIFGEFLIFSSSPYPGGYLNVVGRKFKLSSNLKALVTAPRFAAPDLKRLNYNGYGLIKTKILFARFPFLIPPVRGKPPKGKCLPRRSAAQAGGVNERYKIKSRCANSSFLLSC
jgi:hypothetical protein